MLSIAKMRPGAERYYLDTVARGLEEYYTGAGESPGVWVGSACRDLGLEGEVTTAQLSAVLAGTSPVDGSLLCPSRQPPSRRVAGFDFTFSAPKSVSVLYGLIGDAQSAQVRAAHHRGVLDALSYLESHAAVARRGHDGLVELETSGLVAAGYTHRTSRAGDPQLHTHVLVANLVHGSDDRWSALFTSRAYQHARTAGFVYQAALRSELASRLGVRFGPVTNGSAEIDGIPAGLVKEFSSRRHEILARLDELGGSSRRTREIATLETRPSKDLGHGSDDVGLRERWRSQCLEAGFEPPGYASLRPELRTPGVTGTAYQTMRHELFSWKGLTESVSCFERRDVVRAVAERLGDGARLPEIDNVVRWLMADPEVVALDRTGRGGEQLCTTRDLLEVEQRIFRDGEVMRTARPTGPAGASVAPEIVEAVITERPAMADEQKDMVRRLTTSGDGLQVVIGKAGAGKTYALDAARAAFQRAGYVVCGTALSARAAAELESGAGIASCTLRRFMELDNLLELSPRSVIVVDEAGMVGTRDLQQLVFHAMRKRASVVLVGDHRQLPEIEAGGVLGAVAARFDAITLTENRRQHEGWEREALDELRHGEVARAVLAYSEQGRIHLLDSAPAARVAMVADWAASRQQEPSSRMYAMARADVGELNRLARSELRARGELGDDVLEAAGRGYATGDEVLFCRNDRRLGVLNGTRGTVTGASDDHLVVETDRGHILVDPDYLAEGHLDHGYASTVHKAQGATVARAFVLGGEAMYREAGYVAMSRARERTDLYAVASAFDEGLAPNAEAELARTLSVSRAKELAISSLDPRRAAELEAERQVLAPLAAEQPRGLERAKREVGYAEHRASEHPSGSYDHEVERAEARLAKLEEAKRSFECAHGRELDRLALIEASERIGEHLLGEAVIQAPALGVDVDRERAKVPPLARSAFTRAIGAAQAKVRRVLGWERSDSAEIGHVERQEPVIDTTRRLDPDWDHRLGNDRSRGLSR